MTINGTGFDTKKDTEVFLGGDQLTILTETSTEIVAELSPVIYGSFLLEVIVSGREDEFDLTITEDQGFEAEIASLQATVTDLSDTVALLETQVADQQDDITTLETLLAGVSRAVDPGTEVDTLVFNGLNLQVVNGSEDTGTVNGAGNIIIGYNAGDLLAIESQTGSHNLVIGDNHEYTSFAGIVSGAMNIIGAPYSAAIGGQINYATGDMSFIGGGHGNVAQGDYAAVVGGQGNAAEGASTFVGGGLVNIVGFDATYAAAVGGNRNTANGVASFVAGGANNTVSTENEAIVGGSPID